MAYSYTTTVRQVGPLDFEVQVDETDCGAADEAVLDDVPYIGLVLRVSSALLGGTATTIDPILTRTSPPAAANVTDLVVQPVSTPAADLDVFGHAPYSALAVGPTGLGQLYHSARCDAGADNIVRTLYRIRSGNW